MKYKFDIIEKPNNNSVIIPISALNNIPNSIFKIDFHFDEYFDSSSISNSWK